MRVRALWIVPALVFLWNFGARAASLAEVDAEILKANKSLQSMASASERAKTLTAAVENLHGALEILAKVGGLSPEQTEAKSSEIMATIFWCKKMMPLDLSGRSLDLSSSENKGNSGGEQKAGEGEPAKAAGPELDELAFNRVKDYATKNPNDLPGVVLRYASVAASYPQSKWGQRATQEADQARTKLDALRALSQKALAGKLQKLEFADALAELDKELAAETTEMRKAQLSRTKADFERWQALWQRVLTMSAARMTPYNVSFEELGLVRKGWIKTAKKEGVFIAVENKDAAPAPMPWGEFGAKATLRLAEKFFPLGDVDSLEQLCIGATLAEDYVAAERLFARLLCAAPERVKSVATYFERSQSGYKTDAEGSGRLRLKDIKELVKKRDYPSAMTQLVALQKDLAQNSTLQLFLAEVDQYRRSIRKQYQIDDAGQPITAFERTVRRVFGGDVKLDEKTGDIEVLYDFSNTEQLQDWTVVDSFNKPSVKADWRIANGRAECQGLKTILLWKYPIANVTLTADVSYADPAHRVLVYSCLSQTNSVGVVGACQNGAARLYMPSGGYWYSSSRYIWRPGEVASLRFCVHPGDGWPFSITVNDNHAVSGRIPSPPGSLGLSFDGGAGTVDNVHIQGKLDMEWFKKLLAAVR